MYEEENRKYHLKLSEYEEKNGIIRNKKNKKSKLLDDMDDYEGLLSQILFLLCFERFGKASINDLKKSCLKSN